MVLGADAGESPPVQAPREGRAGHYSGQALGRPRAGDVEQHKEAGGTEVVPAERRTEEMQRFLMVVEEAGENWSAYSPDLAGCVATGATREEAERNMREAVEFHVAGLREEGLPVPQARSSAGYVAVS